MVKQARKKDIGMVFGLEHWPVYKEENGQMNTIVYNLAVSVLPFRTKGNYHNCIVSLRNKNHYSPLETLILESLNFRIPDEKMVYDLNIWRNCWFSGNYSWMGQSRRMAMQGTTVIDKEQLIPGTPWLAFDEMV